MEILAHGLWAGAAAYGVKRIAKKSLRIPWAVFWGIFPDLFAFTLLTIWYGTQVIQENVFARDLLSPSEIEPVSPDTLWIFRLTSVLYTVSHSALVFAVIFSFVFLLRRRVAWEMCGWIFHVVIDVFTHSYGRYPTPVLWPISTWRFDGISWELPWFMILNYGALIVVYALLLKKAHILRLREVFASTAQRYRDFKARRLSFRKEGRGG